MFGLVLRFLSVFLMLFSYQGTLTMTTGVEDPCAFEVTNYLNPNTPVWVGSPNVLKQCFLSIPFVEQLRKDTLAVIDQVIELYSFKDIAKNSGPPYYLSVDLVAERNKIANAKYNSDWEFHNALSQVFTMLKDAHTRYIAPEPYSTTYTLRPFVFTSGISHENQQYIATSTISSSTLQKLIEIAYENISEDLPQYYGKRIREINNVEPMAFFNTFWNTIGIYKDEGVRFNAALNNWDLGASFSFYSHGSYPLPDQIMETYVFEDGLNTDKVDLPLRSLFINPTANTSDFMDRIRASTLNSQKLKLFNSLREKNPLSALELRELLTPSPFTPQLKLLKMDLTPKQSDRLQLQKSSLDGSAQYYIFDKKVSVLKLSSFAPSPEISSDGLNKETDSSYLYQTYKETIKASVFDAHNQGINHMIIDLIGNPGGDVCLNLAVLRFLSKAWQGLGVFQPYDFRESSLTDYLTSMAFPYSFWQRPVNLTSGKVYSWVGTEWYSNAVTITRGGATSKYTQKTTLYCGADDCPFRTYNVPPEILEAQLMFCPAGEKSWSSWIENEEKIYMDKIIILTDGTCGSACSYFATKFQADNKGRLVSVGGLQGKPIETSSFAGGNVLQWDDWVLLTQQWSVLNNRSPLFLLLPTSATISFNFREVYFTPRSKNGTNSTTAQTDVPREFLKIPADYHLDMWNLTDSESLYEETINFFSSPDFPSGLPSQETLGNDSDRGDQNPDNSTKTFKMWDTTFWIIALVGLSVGIILALSIVGLWFAYSHYQRKRAQQSDDALYSLLHNS